MLRDPPGGITAKGCCQSWCGFTEVYFICYVPSRRNSFGLDLGKWKGFGVAVFSQPRINGHMLTLGKGGLNSGSANDASTAPDGLVLQSVGNGHPVLYVAMNYRLNSKPLFALCSNSEGFL
jgi:hypothetical protein